MNKKEIKDKVINEIISYSKENGINITFGLLSLIEKALIAYDEIVTIQNWLEFDFNTLEKRPKKYGKYFVMRKDGKVHWETWNGQYWAYNGNVITHFAEIKGLNGEIIHQSC